MSFCLLLDVILRMDRCECARSCGGWFPFRRAEECSVKYGKRTGSHSPDGPIAQLPRSLAATCNQWLNPSPPPALFLEWSFYRYGAPLGVGASGSPSALKQLIWRGRTPRCNSRTMSPPSASFDFEAQAEKLTRFPRHVTIEDRQPTSPSRPGIPDRLLSIETAPRLTSEFRTLSIHIWRP